MDRSTAELLDRVRRLEDEGQVKEAIALARGAAEGRGHDWVAEIARLESEGKLARPYREGIEALREGDYSDAQRLLSWVSGRAPRYREVSRYLFWAVEGRDPSVAAVAPAVPATSASIDEDADEDVAPAPRSPLASPLTWVLLFLAFGTGFALGGLMGSRELVVAEIASPPAAETTPEATASAEPTPAEPTPAEPTPAEPAPAEPAPAEPAPAEPAPTAAPVETAPAAPAEPDKAVARPTEHTTPPAAPSAADKANEAAVGCQNGSAKSCFTLGDVYYYGRGVSKSMSAALTAYTTACDLRYGRGCFNAGDMVEKGEAGTPDAKRAYELYKKACDLNEGNACTRKVLYEVTQTGK